MHAVERWITRVVAGKETVGKLVLAAVKRQGRDLKQLPKKGFYFDEAAAEHALAFFRFLRHSKGEWAGQEFVLEPWQQFIVWCLFGWKRKDGTRRFRTALIEVARKNGKSTLLAGIELYMFFADGEPGAEVYTAATKRDQARIVHQEAIRMVRSSPSLSSRIGIVKDNLHVQATNSKFEPLGADEDSMDGLNPHCIGIDELHAHKSRGIWDKLKSSQGARRQPLFLAITTAGYDMQTVWGEQHDLAIRILQRIVPDESFFAFIATIDEKDEWTDPKCWPKANPNLGVSVKRQYLLAECETAKVQPTAQNAFRRFLLNQLTQQDVRALPMEAWDKCPAVIGKETLAGRECYGGLDVASTIDIAAFGLLFPPLGEDDPYTWLPEFWVPRENLLHRAHTDHAPYDLWLEQGLIHATEGNVIDYDVIRARINELGARYNILEIAKDPWNSTQLGTQLAGDGFTIVDIRQGFMSLTAPTKELLKLVVSQRLNHGGNPVMRWMASNLSVSQDPAGNLKPDRRKSTAKIDGIAALVDALARALVRPDGGSPYETRGVLVI